MEMTHYVAIVEDGGSDHATGIWFPDLPGCFSGGDTLDEAIANASEAVELHIQSMIEDGKAISPPRQLSAIKSDPEWAEDVENNMIVLIPAPSLLFRPAAE
jgi:predicted RNase H-like HicB family nuclease